VIAAAGVLSPEEVAKEDEERKAAAQGPAGEDIWEVSDVAHRGILRNKATGRWGYQADQ
jgi:hypothetical protein